MDKLDIFVLQEKTCRVYLLDMLINLADYVTETEIARRLGVVPRTIARWEADGIIPRALRLGPRLKKHNWPAVCEALNLPTGKEVSREN